VTSDRDSARNVDDHSSILSRNVGCKYFDGVGMSVLHHKQFHGERQAILREAAGTPSNEALAALPPNSGRIRVYNPGFALNGLDRRMGRDYGG